MSNTSLRVSNDERVQSTSSFGEVTGRTLSEFRTKMRDLATSQAQLAENRQQVLIDRQRLESSAEQIRAHRMATGRAEARLMDCFRQYYVKIGIPLPTDLVLLYRGTENARNKLAVAEDSYSEIRQELELAELNLTEEEEDLYQRDIELLLSEHVSSGPAKSFEISGSPRRTSIETSSSVQYHASLKTYRALLQRFRKLRSKDMAMINHASSATFTSIRSELDNASSSPLALFASDIIGQLILSEVKMQHAKANLAPDELIALPQIRTLSEPNLRGHLRHERTQIPSESKSDRAAHVSATAAPHMTIVDDWLLGCLQNNATNKMYYILMLQDAFRGIMKSREFEDWSETIIDTWLSDEEALRVYHDSMTLEASRWNREAWSLPPLPAFNGRHGQTASPYSLHDTGIEPVAGSDIDRIGKLPEHSIIEFPTYYEDVHSSECCQTPLPLGNAIPSGDEQRPHESSALHTGIPIWTVTAPYEDHEPSLESIPLEYPNIKQKPSSRCDSAHNSDSGQQCHNKPVFTAAPIMQLGGDTIANSSSHSYVNNIDP